MPNERPKPFQPQLLRRPQAEQHTQPDAQGASTNTQSNPAQQRDALLALFAKSASPQVSQAPSSITNDPKAMQEQTEPSAALAPALSLPSEREDAHLSSILSGVSAWNQLVKPPQQGGSGASVSGSALPSSHEDKALANQVWKEAFKQTSSQDTWSGGPRKIVAVEKSVHNGNTQDVIAGIGKAQAGLPMGITSPLPFNRASASGSPLPGPASQNRSETPSGTKDFLVGYLDSLVRSEQQKKK